MAALAAIIIAGCNNQQGQRAATVAEKLVNPDAGVVGTYVADSYGMVLTLRLKSDHTASREQLENGYLQTLKMTWRRDGDTILLGQVDERDGTTTIVMRERIAGADLREVGSHFMYKRRK